MDSFSIGLDTAITAVVFFFAGWFARKLKSER
jgi:hypothetical protein